MDKKSPWLHYNKRVIKLYTTPKIDYLDPKTNNLKGTIFLEIDCYAKATDDSNFDVITKHRTYSFKINNKSANFWANTINQTIKTSQAFKGRLPKIKNKDNKSKDKNNKSNDKDYIKSKEKNISKEVKEEVKK